MLDKTFRLRTDNANLQWLQRQRHISHHQTCWLNLLAEYQPRVVHIPDRTNPAGFLALERFPGAPGLVHHTGDDSALGPFTASGSAPASALVTTGPAAESTRFDDRPAPVHAILRLFTRQGARRPPHRAHVAAVPTFQAAATETTARSSLASAEREGHFAGAFRCFRRACARRWARRSPSARHNAAPSQVGNGVVAGALRSSAGERARDFFFWPALVRLVELAINGSASPSGPATRPSTPTAASTPAL